MREMGEREGTSSLGKGSVEEEKHSQGNRSFGKVNRNQHELNYKAGQEGGSRKNWLQTGKIETTRRGS